MLSVYANGDTYVGDWERGQKHGKGVYTFARSGDKYTGDFSRGNMHGEGKYAYGHGGDYEGGFVGGKAEGKGRYTHVDADGDFTVSIRIPPT